ncbi:MAG: leucine-rich repeat domain-containing protein [Clostridia bacterium]|nr:leucine-rich repeat domain-containing protein [Clostridia bacterium]
MKRKKFLALGLAAITALFAAVGVVGCGDGGNGDGAGDGSGDGNGAQGSLEYILSEDGTYYTVRGTETYESTDIVIPSDYQGKPVKEISAHAFNNDDITSIVIGDNVEIIGNDAFHDCYDLTSIVIGKGVTEIGVRAFMNCEALTGIDVAEDNTAYKDIDGHLYTKDGKTLLQYSRNNTATEYVSPEGLETIAEEAVSGADNLVTVQVNCNTIGKWAFSRCDNITSVKLGDAVTEIGEEAFRSCGKLEKVELGAGLKNVGRSAFYETNGITDVYYKGSVADWCGITFGSGANPTRSAGNLYFYNGTEYELLGDTLVIPDTVTEIKAYAFFGCSVANLIIGKNVTAIGESAFPYYSKNVYFKGEDSKELEDRFSSLTKFFYYSETPNYDGYHWYYQGDVPTIW